MSGALPSWSGASATVREQREVAAQARAEAWFVLARALWDAPEGEGRDRTRAVLLAEQARGGDREAHTGSAEAIATVEAWLAEHRG